MKAKLLAWGGVSAVLLGAAGAAEAQLPVARTYRSGQHGASLAAAHQNGGGIRVIFEEVSVSVDRGNVVEWVPTTGSIRRTDGRDLRHFDGLSRFVIGLGPNGNEIYDFQTRTWTPVQAPGTIPSGYPTIYKSDALWPEYSGIFREPGLTLYDVGTGTRRHFLFANRRSEEHPRLHAGVVAYEYSDGAGPKVALHDLGSDRQIFDTSLHRGFQSRPDVWGDLVTWVDSNSGIVWWDYVDAVSRLPETIGIPVGCREVDRPRFIGEGWIAYAAYCASGWELRVHDLDTRFDQRIDGLSAPENFHAGFGWLVYSDASREVVALLLAEAGPFAVPVDDAFKSGVRGFDPAVAHDRYDWHVVFSDGVKTLDWVPDRYLDSIGYAMRSYSGVGYQVAAVDQGKVVAWDFDRRTWYTMGEGQYPSSFKTYIAWQEPANPDTSIGWGASMAGGGPWSSHYFRGDWMNQGPPSLYESTIAYEVSGLLWDSLRNRIEVFDLLRGVVLGVVEGGGRVSSPSLWNDAIVWVDHARNELRYRPYYNGRAEWAVPMPAGCTPSLPRLGGDGSWVLYSVSHCAQAGTLYLANMNDDFLWTVGVVAPANGHSPQYAIVKDKVAYVDGATGQVVYLDLDEDRI